MARDSLAMSWAVDCWPRCGNPDALRKVVRAMPNWRALAVIISAKRRSVRPSASATTEATSLADLITSA